MNIGIIGLGSIGSRHVQNLQTLYPKANLTILTRRASWEEAGPHTQLVSSEKKFFAIPQDIYFITNETYKHTDMAIRCLAQHPKGLFVEKPLAHTSSAGRRIAHAAKGYRGVFFVGYSMQFFSPYAEIRRLLAAGAIGKPLSMRISVGQDLRAWRATDYRKGYSADTKKGGGVVLDLIHEINIGSWLLREPLTFVAGAAGQLGDLHINAEDTAESLFISPGGTVVSVHQDYLAVPGHRSITILGKKGTLTWEWVFGTQKPHAIQIHTAKRDRTIVVTEERGAMYHREMKAFFSKMRSGKPWSNLSEALLDIEHADSIKRKGFGLD